MAAAKQEEFLSTKYDGNEEVTRNEVLKEDPGSTLTTPQQNQTESIKQRFMATSTLANGRNPDLRPLWYDLTLKTEFASELGQLKRKLVKYSIGNPKSNAPMKTILLMGATGAGKTTLLNSIINYIIGVEYEDDFRFRLVCEATSGDQSKSQTQDITAYIIYHEDQLGIPFSLTIVDTPGFGDTSGIEADKEITEALREFFSMPGKDGIDSLDAVGFVVQASQSRLTPTQSYIFDSILALFGKDIEDNIFIMATFADCQEPEVINALKAAEIKYTHLFKLNNAVVFADRKIKKKKTNFEALFWDMGTESYESFFEEVDNVKTQSLKLTQDVLDERQRIETYVSGLQNEMKSGLFKLDDLNTAAQCLKDHETEIDRNKDFTYTVNEEVAVKIDMQGSGRYNTTCLVCNRTCHYPCKIPNDEDKAGCVAMNRSSDPHCYHCECHWSKHANLPYRFETQPRKTTRTVNEMKVKYEAATGKKLKAKELVDKVIAEICDKEIKLVSLADNIRKSLERLKEIALRPDPLSTCGYVDTLIQSEKSQAKLGWQERVEQLQRIRETAELIQNIANDDSCIDPFVKIKQQIDENHKTAEYEDLLNKIKSRRYWTTHD